MTKAETKFNKLKDIYVKQFRRVNNRNVDVRFESGFVFIKAEGHLNEHKYRVSVFELMANTISDRPDYIAPKEKFTKTIDGHIEKENTDVEDNGQALITTIDFRDTSEDEDNGMFVRIQSWDEKCQHTEFKKFEGRKIRITIETID